MQYKLEKIELKLKECQSKKIIKMEILKRSQEHHSDLVEKIDVFEDKLKSVNESNAEIETQLSQIINKNWEKNLSQQNDEIHRLNKQYCQLCSNVRNLEDKIWKIDRVNKSKQQNIQKLQNDIALENENQKEFHKNNITKIQQKYENLKNRQKQIQKKIQKSYKQIIKNDKYLDNVINIENELSNINKDNITILKELKRDQQNLIRKYGKQNIYI